MGLAARWLGIGLLLVMTNAGVGQAGQPPPPAPVPPNASLVTAMALKYSIWNTSLLQTMPTLQPGFTVYSLVVEVQRSERVSEQLENLAKTGDLLEAFSTETLAPDLFGKKIEAVLKLGGDTRGVRWWISQIRVLPSLP